MLPALHVYTCHPPQPSQAGRQQDALQGQQVRTPAHTHPPSSHTREEIEAQRPPQPMCLTGTCVAQARN
jgi:hypothetical protein